MDQATPSTNGNGILTLPEVAQRLRVSRTWVYKKCEAGIMPHFRIGRMVRFREKELDEWLLRHWCKGAEKI